MSITKLQQVFGLMLAVISISACSNSKPATPAKSKTVIKHRVDITESEKKAYANLIGEWKKQGLLKNKDAKVVSNAKQAKPSLKNSNSLKRSYKTAAPIKPKVNNKQLATRSVTKKHKDPVYRTPSYKASVSNIRYASLTGDYAQNQQTKAFINRMVAIQGFDRGYLNYLFSHTEATPFLQRMAYNDAFGKKKSKKARVGSWNRYRGNFLTEKTISKGVHFWRANRVALQRAEQQYGVPQEYILGIIGVETRYGGNVGKNRAIDALSAMGFNNPRRGKYFRSELESYLVMTRKEGLDPLKPMASYAGALGLSQFMPSNIKRYAVDHDRNGTVNLWTPHDAIGSVANYFKRHGWKSGGTVAVPAKSSTTGYMSLRTGFKSKHSLASLNNLGVSASNLGNISGKASLIKLNTYSGDELWLGGHNFYVITRYNHSSHYAMAVHQLAQAINSRIGGRGVIRQASLDSVLKSMN